MRDVEALLEISDVATPPRKLGTSDPRKHSNYVQATEFPEQQTGHSFHTTHHNMDSSPSHPATQPTHGGLSPGRHTQATHSDMSSAPYSHATQAGTSPGTRHYTQPAHGGPSPSTSPGTRHYTQPTQGSPSPSTSPGTRHYTQPVHGDPSASISPATSHYTQPTHSGISAGTSPGAGSPVVVRLWGAASTSAAASPSWREAVGMTAPASDVLNQSLAPGVLGGMPSHSTSSSPSHAAQPHYGLGTSSSQAVQPAQAQAQTHAQAQAQSVHALDGGQCVGRADDSDSDAFHLAEDANDGDYDTDPVEAALRELVDFRADDSPRAQPLKQPGSDSRANDSPRAQPLKQPGSDSRADDSPRAQPLKQPGSGGPRAKGGPKVPHSLPLGAGSSTRKPDSSGAPGAESSHRQSRSRRRVAGLPSHSTSSSPSHAAQPHYGPGTSSSRAVLPAQAQTHTQALAQAHTHAQAQAQAGGRARGGAGKAGTAFVGMMSFYTAYSLHGDSPTTSARSSEGGGTYFESEVTTSTTQQFSPPLPVHSEGSASNQEGAAPSPRPDGPPVPASVLQMAAQYAGDEGMARPASAMPSALRRGTGAASESGAPVPQDVLEVIERHSGQEGGGRPGTATPSVLRKSQGRTDAPGQPKEMPVPEDVLQVVRRHEGQEGQERPSTAAPSVLQQLFRELT
eukprot:gene21869-28901_t